MGIEFFDLYNEKTKSTGTRPIQTANGTIYKYDLYGTKKYEIIAEKDIKATSSIIKFIQHDENILKTKSDIIKYMSTIKDILFTQCLNLDKWKFDFAKIKRLTTFVAKQSLNGNEVVVDNTKLLECIDEASAGGVLIAKQGDYNKYYNCVDINSSYNLFFLHYEIPTNPQFKTVDSIIEKKTFALYKLNIEQKYKTREMTIKFKTSREWYTKFDIKIFDLYNIKYDLSKTENNCVVFDKVKSNFEWMENVNEYKQKSANEIEKHVLKYFLSSFWGQLSQYRTITEDEWETELSTKKYFHKIDQETGIKKFIHPEQYYCYSMAIAKPFVTAYARLRLLEQIKKVEDEGFNVIYAHTDSIISNCDKMELFEIGKNIGDYKLEKSSDKGVVIHNIASKTWK